MKAKELRQKLIDEGYFISRKTEERLRLMHEDDVDIDYIDGNSAGEFFPWLKQDTSKLNDKQLQNKLLPNPHEHPRLKPMSQKEWKELSDEHIAKLTPEYYWHHQREREKKFRDENPEIKERPLNHEDSGVTVDIHWQSFFKSQLKNDWNYRARHSRTSDSFWLNAIGLAMQYQKAEEKFEIVQELDCDLTKESISPTEVKPSHPDVLGVAIHAPECTPIVMDHGISQEIAGKEKTAMEKICERENNVNEEVKQLVRDLIYLKFILQCVEDDTVHDENYYSDFLSCFAKKCDDLRFKSTNFFNKRVLNLINKGKN